MDNEIGFWIKITTGIVAVTTVAIGTLKGFFVTNAQCRAKSKQCLIGVREELAEIKKELDRGHQKFESAERWIVALAQKQGVKESDLPKL